MEIRKKLEMQKLFIGCQGSVKNVYPSAMSLDMSLGKIAYILQLGERANQKNLVDIFDPVPVEAVGTVQEQNNYFAKWRESFKII